MLTTIRYVLLTALRDWLFAGLSVMLLAAIGISSFLGSTSLVEQGEASVVYISGAARVIVHIGLIVFVCFHIRRAFDHKEIELILSRPISRGAFVFAYWLGFAAVASLLIAPLALAIHALYAVNTGGLLLWTGSVTLEAFLVVAFALFAALILRSAVSSVLLCFAFYFLSRLMGFFLYLLDAPYVQAYYKLGAVTEKILWLVSLILPRLDLYGQGEWLVYGQAGYAAAAIFLAQTLIYVPLLLGMAVFDFNRKQF